MVNEKSLPQYVITNVMEICKFINPFEDNFVKCLLNAIVIVGSLTAGSICTIKVILNQNNKYLIFIELAICALIFVPLEISIIYNKNIKIPNTFSEFIIDNFLTIFIILLMLFIFNGNVILIHLVLYVLLLLSKFWNVKISIIMFIILSILLCKYVIYKLASNKRQK